MTSRHAFSPHLAGAIAPSAVAGCLPALIFVRMVAEQVCFPLSATCNGNRHGL